MRNLIILLPIIVLHTLIFGSEKPAPFSQSIITVEFGNRQGQNDFDTYWQSGALVGLSLTMPFYFGGVQGGIQAISFHAGEKSTIEFKSLFIYVGWGVKHPITNRFSFGGVVRLGMDVMTFPHAQEYGNELDQRTLPVTQCPEAPEFNHPAKTVLRPSACHSFLYILLFTDVFHSHNTFTSQLSKNAPLSSYIRYNPNWVPTKALGII